MGRWQRDADTWLTAEQHGEDDAADTAFDRVFRALPAVDPSPAFVSRAAEAAWAARLRRRWLAGAAAAAAVVAAVAAATVLYAGLGAWVGWVLATATSVASASLVSGLGAALTAVQWWAATAAAGSTLASAAATPYTLAAVALAEFVAVSALYGLHRLLRADVGVRMPRAWCF